MLPEKLYEYHVTEIEDWLRFEAGVNNGPWFSAVEGGLELQQIPEEYSEFLDYIRSKKFKRYLNIGIGNGGSFITEIYIQPTLEYALAVDNLSYSVSNESNVYSRLEWIKSKHWGKVDFFKVSSQEFFESIAPTLNIKFDFIFIDGDHSYEGVKYDYDNALKYLEDGGEIAFHDITSEQCPGVVRLWNEIKNDNCIEISYSTKCGIGIWK